MLVEFRSEEWTSGPVWVARSFHDRWFGLRAALPGNGLLLRGSAVHGRGMATPLTVVGLDGTGRVLGVRKLAPGKWVRFPGASWVLELAGRGPPPSLGTALQPHVRR